MAHKTPALRLVRESDGKWALYPPGTTDETIAAGDLPPMVRGISGWGHASQRWSAPSNEDYRRARKLLREGWPPKKEETIQEAA